ncbi:hypothetical protein FRC12_015884 [Ceratobasidium sp. 428]|nr:hypothetical protein FRC12_015884 [Ceratobasidium sp. 428]
MQFSNTVVALYAIALAGYAAAQGGSMTINTPASVVQCQPVQLSWSGGTAPYFPSIIPGSQPGAAALKEFPSQQGTSLTWKCDLQQGTQITMQVRDSTGAVQYSSAVPIQNSSDSSCVNSNVSASPSGGPAATSTPGGSTTPNSPAPSGTAPSGPSSSNKPPAASTSAAPSASASPNAASSVTTGAFGVAAFAGLLGAALF